MKIFYVPLESYQERYTCQLSAPKIGWLESRWVENKIPYVRIEGDSTVATSVIESGTVLDAFNRGIWSCSQIQKLLVLMSEGEVTSNDVIYFDDFWTPGISALPYAFHLTGIRPKMYAMLHAQSIDKFDFTHAMCDWMRYFEKGISKILSGIFVTSTCLRDLCLFYEVGTTENVFLCGLPYNSDEVRTHFPSRIPKRKPNQVIYSSRWDSEKDPGFFMNLMEESINLQLEWNFVITTSAKTLRSNDPALISRLKYLLDKHPEHIQLRENQSKEEYYYNLLESQIQINTADQDFVSWTLLEATTCGCRPCYPNFLSFPEVLPSEFLYQKRNVESALQNLKNDVEFNNIETDYSFIYKPFDLSWKRMLSIMSNDRTFYNDNPLHQRSQWKK